jgi:hypothetical protein
MKKFKVLDYYSDDIDIFAVDWSKIPKEIVEELPSIYFINVNVVNDKGKLAEKTVVYMTEVETLTTDHSYVDNDKDISIGWDDFNYEDDDLF